MSVFCLMVTTPPHQNQSATVIEVIEGIISQGHKINGIFFYQDAVIAANAYVSMPNDEFQFIDKIIALKEKHDLPIHLCITAAEKRGLTDNAESNNINQHFIVSGLGEMVELSSTADRVIQL